MLTLTPNPDSTPLSKEEEEEIATALEADSHEWHDTRSRQEFYQRFLSSHANMQSRIKELEEMVGNFNLRTDLTLKRISELEAENERLKDKTPDIHEGHNITFHKLS